MVPTQGGAPDGHRALHVGAAQGRDAGHAPAPARYRAVGPIARHGLLDALAQLHDLGGVFGQAPVLVVLRHPCRHRCRLALDPVHATNTITQCVHKRSPPSSIGSRATHVDREMHAAGAGMHELGRDGHQVADAHGRDETDAADGDGHAVLAAPADRGGIADLVDPFHHHAAVHLAAIVDVGGFGEEPESQFALVSAHVAAAVYSQSPDYASSRTGLRRTRCDGMLATTPLGETKMGRTLLGILAGLVSMWLVTWSIEFASHALYPPPPGLDPRDTQSLGAILAAAPFAALAMLVGAWLLGAFAGGFVAAKIARHPRAAATIVALVTVLGVVAMIFLVPGHPVWVSALGVLLPIPLALLGARLAGSKRAGDRSRELSRRRSSRVRIASFRCEPQDCGVKRLRCRRSTCQRRQLPATATSTAPPAGVPPSVPHDPNRPVHRTTATGTGRH